MKIKTEGKQIFNVPNTPEGNAFVTLATKYLNHSRFDNLRKKGRGKNRPKTFGGDLAVKDAEWFAVYANDNSKSHFQTMQQDQLKWHVELGKREVRMELAKAQLNGGALLPETIQLIREQVIKEEKNKIRAQVLDECKKAIEEIKG